MFAGWDMSVAAPIRALCVTWFHWLRYWLRRLYQHEQHSFIGGDRPTAILGVVPNGMNNVCSLVGILLVAATFGT